MAVLIYILDTLRKASQPCVSDLRLPRASRTSSPGRTCRSLPIHTFPASLVDLPPMLILSFAAPASAYVSSPHFAANAPANVSSPHSPAPAAQPHSASHSCPVCALRADVSCVCCAEQFCPRHTYLCPDCQSVFCADCLDLHLTEGHWSDSDTTTAFAQHNRAPHYATPKLSNQPASVYAIHDGSKTTDLAEPVHTNSSNHTSRDINPNPVPPTTTQHPTQYILVRLAPPLKPNLGAIANFIRLLAHSLLPPGLHFAFPGTSSCEVRQ